MLKPANDTRYRRVSCNYGGDPRCPKHVVHDDDCWTPDENGTILKEGSR